MTIRAARLLPFSLAPVIEDVVDRIELRLRFGPRFDRVRARPLAVMTQRRRLDAFLAEQAAASGVDFRDGCPARAVELAERGVTVRTNGERVRADAVIGADGANGITARALRLCSRPAYGVALEGNLPLDAVDARRYRGRIVFELGVVRGGYGWIFPKGDHLNVGVGGWQREARTLRNHLARVCREHGFSDTRLRDLRGHRLPVRTPEAELARGRALVVGDAAGLVDPFTGDGIYEAFVSATVAADATADLLAGRTRDLTAYERRVKGVLARELSTAWAAKIVLDRAPSVMFAVARSELVQVGLERLARGERAAPGASRFPRAPLSLLGSLARTAGNRGHAVATRRAF